MTEQKRSTWCADSLMIMSDTTLRTMKVDLEVYLKDLAKDIRIARDAIREALDLMDEIDAVIVQRRNEK